MKKAQRQCIQFGNLVMEGRDIGTNIFPETDFKFYLDANLQERTQRREAEGVQEDLAARDERDSQRAAAPLMIPLGAVIVNNSGQTPEQTSGHILEIIRRRLKEREDARLVARQKPRW
jgi:cytidylate kinase